MRETDRKKNGMDFPKLYYPEIYLLDGGYKAFYEQYSVRHIVHTISCIICGPFPEVVFQLHFLSLGSLMYTQNPPSPCVSP